MYETRSLAISLSSAISGCDDNDYIKLCLTLSSVCVLLSSFVSKCGARNKMIASNGHTLRLCSPNQNLNMRWNNSCSNLCIGILMCLLFDAASKIEGTRAQSLK